jgi:O-antigen ligase
MNNREVPANHLVVLAQMALYFFIFRMMDFRSKLSARFFWASFLFISFTMIVLDLGTTAADPTASLALSEEYIAGYQNYAQIYMFVVLCCIATTPKIIPRYGMYVVTLFTLFVNGARSEMIVIIPVILIAEAHYFRGKLLIAMIMASVAMIFLPNIAEWLTDAFPDNRVVLLLNGLTTDASYNQRQYYNDQALAVIRDAPIFGSYAYYPEGAYAHNILSMWADFGLFGMGLLLVCLALPLSRALRDYYVGKSSPEGTLLASLAVGSVALLTAKTYTHPIILMTLAIYARQIAGDRAQRFRTSRHAGRAVPA